MADLKKKAIPLFAPDSYIPGMAFQDKSIQSSTATARAKIV